MWNNNEYNNLILELKNASNKEYLKFTKKITFTPKEMLGVNIPTLRKHAKNIANKDIDSFLNFYQGKYFEETMIYGLALGYLKDKEALAKYILLYSTEIVDWSLCDSPAINMKLIRKHNEYFLPIINKLLKSKEEFVIRFGLVILLGHYVNEQYIDYIIKVIISIKSDYYYVNMALAWLLCECYIYFPDKSKEYIDLKYLNKFVFTKTISKICDSYRVSKEEKELLKKKRSLVKN